MLALRLLRSSVESASAKALRSGSNLAGRAIGYSGRHSSLVCLPLLFREDLNIKDGYTFRRSDILLTVQLYPHVLLLRCAGVQQQQQQQRCGGRRHLHSTIHLQRRLKKQYTVQELLDNAASRVDFILPEDAIHMYNRDDGTVFLDVREPPEWVETGLVKNALPVPRGVLEFVCEERIPKDAMVVIYCRNGYRAALAGSTLLDLGYENVLNAGGIDELSDAGIDIEDFAPPSA